MRNYVGTLQRVLSCVTNAILLHGGHAANVEHALRLAGSEAPVAAASQRFLLRVAQYYAVVSDPEAPGTWRVTTSYYAYAISDAAGREILAYHWHPAGISDVTTPHLHLGPSAGVSLAELQKAHIPTARIALEDVIRLLVRDFAVRPLRDDWDRVLSAAQAEYERRQRWSGSGAARRTGGDS